jgi:hypothetical protein
MKKSETFKDMNNKKRLTTIKKHKKIDHNFCCAFYHKSISDVLMAELLRTSTVLWDCSIDLWWEQAELLTK